MALGRAGLRDRVPELLLEAVFVVFAVLVALAVDECWEGREEQELARVAQENVAAEIDANLDELTRADRDTSSCWPRSRRRSPPFRQEIPLD